MNNIGNCNRVYIIGDNGSGKSRWLANDAEVKSKSNHVVVISSVVSDKFKFGSKVKEKANGSYTYLGNRTVGNASHINVLSANAIIYSRKLIEKNRIELFFEILNDLGFDREIGIRHRKVKSPSIKEAFNDEYFNADVIIKLDKYLDSKTKPFKALFYKKGKAYPFDLLSSGEQSILLLVLKILSVVEDGVCFYIDEPEVSLHSSWQVKWPEILHSIVDRFQSVKTFVATHSPIIISSALSIKSQCFILKDSEFINIDGKNNVEGIIFDDFKTITNNNKYLYTKMADITNEIIDSNGNLSESMEDIDLKVNDLRNQIMNSSFTELSKDEINRKFNDFESAIEQIKKIKQNA